MITPEINSNWVYNEHWTTQTFYGLSTDTKPTTHIVNGSVFIEMDTATLYFFDQENTEWRAWEKEE